MNEGTKTQPAPNISTEHQKDGDARRPSDTLDKKESGNLNFRDIEQGSDPDPASESTGTQ